MFVGKVKEPLSRRVEDTRHPLQPFLVIGRLVRWREGLTEPIQDPVEYIPQFLRYLVQREAFLSELGHVLANLAGDSVDIAECVSEVVDLFLYVELACGFVEVLVGHFQESICISNDLLPEGELNGTPCDVFELGESGWMGESISGILTSIVQGTNLLAGHSLLPFGGQQRLDGWLRRYTVVR